MAPSEESTNQVQFTLRLPVDLHADITVRAKELDRSVNWYIQNSLQVTQDRLQTYPDALPESEYGQCPAQYTATFAFRMPNFSFPEDNDLSAPDEGRVGTERRIESALQECAHVLRRWGCTEDIVVHSIFAVGGARLPSRITNYPDGTIHASGVDTDLTVVGEIVVE